MISVSPQEPAQPLRKVLHIEDDRGQARIVQASFAKFAREKFELHWASTYEEGLTLLREKQYDACLLDYQLGPRSGLDLLREVVNLGIDTPVIFVTSESSPDIDDEAMALGALDYLVKFEISPRSLERSLRYTIKQHVTLRELRRLVTRDPLTGLYNRREGMALLEHEAEKARKFACPLALVLIDIDRFKEINLAHGQAIGDRTLCTVAHLMREAVRDAGIVTRLGGDEFGVWLPHTGAMAGSRIAEAILSAARQLNFTLSVGVAEWRSNYTTVTELLAAADRALLEAKAAGGNRVA